MRYTVVEILGEEPIDAVAVKERLHLLPPSEAEVNYTINPLIVAAREYCEGIAGYAFIKQRIEAYPELAELNSVVNLPRPPIIKIDGVTLHHADGTDEITTDYEFDGEDGRLYLNVDANGLRVVDPVTVEYIAGADQCPEMARQAMLLLIGHWYQNRESVQTGAVTAVEIAQTTNAILKQYKRWW